MLLLALVLAFPTSSQAPEGRWLTQDGTAAVTIAPCATGLCGTITRILARRPKVPTTDINNPDRRLQSRRLEGLRILSGFKQQGASWKGGTIYDPKSGRTYKASFTLNRNGSLTVTGCVFVICQSQRWTRM